MRSASTTYLHPSCFNYPGKLRWKKLSPRHRNVSLAMEESELELALRRPHEERAACAKEIFAKPVNKFKDKAAHPHRSSRIYAQEALHLSKYPATKKIKLRAVRIGPIAIAAIPCEVFAEIGLAIKKASPHKHTFTIELANGYGGYLPPRERHELGGYEMWPARSSFLEVDAEAKILEETLRLLEAVDTR